MTGNILFAALLVALASAPVRGGASGTADAQKMEMMKAEMVKCSVCKHMADVVSVVKPEVVKMDNGMAMIDKVTDASMVGTFHAACDKMGEAGAACMAMTDEQARTDVCELCQGIRDAMKAGAQMSHGKTRDGSLMVIMSNDPAVQAQIAALHQKCEMMMSQMDNPMTGAAKKN